MAFSARTILHPTDLSRHSTDALEVAGSLARDQGARLILLHVVDAPPVPLAVVTGEIPPRTTSREVIDELRRVPLPLPLSPDQVSYRVEEGPTTGTILRVAGQTGADLIVMGSQGRTGLKRLLLGSVAEGVLRAAPCPVLIVKSSSTAADPSSEPAESESLASTLRDSLRTPHD